MKIQDGPYVYPNKLNDVFFGGKVDLDVLGQNMRHIDNFMSQYQQTDRTMRTAIDEKFEDMERRIQDAVSLMHYTLQFYPVVVNEWQVAQRAKQRLEVSDTVPTVNIP